MLLFLLPFIEKLFPCTIPEVTINDKDKEGVDEIGHEGYSGQGKEELPGQQVIDHTSIS